MAEKAVPEGLQGDAALVFLTFVQELAPYISIWQRMRAEHVPTSDGYCAARMCGRGGSGIAYVKWPCSTRLLAGWAWKAHQRREETE
jgi:hypothetical protein